MLIAGTVNAGQRECERHTRFHYWDIYLTLLLINVTFHLSLGTLTDNDILIKNSGVDVFIGRHVFVSPDNDLKINVSEKDRCRVTVLQSDLLSQGPGKLQPQNFPCNFPQNSVQYIHYGAKEPKEDYLHLMIHYESANQSLIIPLIFHVKIQNVQYQIVTKNIPLNVTKLSGLSNSFSDSNTGFSYDRDNQRCKITLLSQVSGLPRYGYIANDTSEFVMVDCDKFLQLDIIYKLFASASSSNRDFIPLVVEITDTDGDLMYQEYFHKPIIIEGGLQNTRPQPSFNALLVMDVSQGNAIDQFIMTSISSKILAAEDKETPAAQLIFNVTKPLGPDQGELVSTNDRNQPLRSFYQKDVFDLRIAYKPPKTDSDKIRSFQIELQVIDGDGLRSAPFTLLISVKPMNTLSPIVTLNRGVQMFEGQSRPLHTENLQISDEDNLNNVKIFVVDGVRHGELKIPGNRNYFTPKDLKDGTVIYKHDGTDTYSDNIVLRMTDGTHSVEFLFPVTIYPVDDESPVLSYNTGLDIKKGQIVEVNKFVLSATDVDSEDAEILFIQQPPYSVIGRFLRRQFSAHSNQTKWQYINGVYQQVANEFTQQEISDGKIFYQHFGPGMTRIIVDRIKLKLSDRMDPPNLSQEYTFIVKILPVDDTPPRLDEATLQLNVNEFQMTVIKKKNLKYTDESTVDRNLKYQISRQPYDTDKYTRLPAGRLVLCDSPSEGVSSFTQAHVNHLKICYVPPNRELGLTKRIIFFNFNVEDMHRNILRNEQFQIIIHPNDNKPPRVQNTGFHVLENGEFSINQNTLKISDPDTENSLLKIIITQLPKHGVLKNLQQPLIQNDSLTLRDIASGNIIYKNSGDEATKDSFNVYVTDGIHRVPAFIPIKIDPVDDESPSFVGDQSNVLFIRTQINEGGSTMEWNRQINATDPDTNDLDLTFIIKNRPRKGRIVMNNQLVTSFTQKNLIDGILVYQHLSKEIGMEETNDSFVLALTDNMEGFVVQNNNVKTVEVLIQILPVNDKAPEIIFGAPYGVKEGEKSPILPRHLDAMDEDTSYNFLQCVITRQPSFGYLENMAPAPGSEKSQQGIPISAFYVEDLRLGNINYIQSVHKRVEIRKDEFRFRCNDGTNQSPVNTFPIVVYPENDEEPEVYIREFIVMEGMELKIDAPILKAVDKDDPPGSLTYIISRPPEHGQIVQQRTIAGIFPVSSFNENDIAKSSTIMYKHDDSETLRDSFEFILTDGTFNITRTVPIIILPLDDETPRLTVNNGLEIEVVGGRKLITNNHLRAEDIDSEDSNITFIIRAYPKYGYVLKRGNDGVVRNLTLHMNFTQFDIDNNRVWYVHTDTNSGQDLIKFDVTDGLNPIVDRYFHVTIAELDTIYPQVISRGVQLPEGGFVTLTTDMIGGTDINSPDEDLRFTITKAPIHGFLESTDKPGSPILVFTQLDLVGSKIRYVHNSNSEIKMDGFQFEVTDGNNPVTRTFRIAITDVDNKKPVLFCNNLRMQEGGNKIITPFDLRVEDLDTPNQKITFYITQVPLHGNILKNFSQTVNTFTYEDIVNNLITYQHDGTETTRDEFSFTITDNTNVDFYVLSDMSIPTRLPQTLIIEVVPVDNGIPSVSINKRITSLGYLPNGRTGVKLTSKVLRAEDRDSTDDNLTFLLTVLPQHGHLVNTRKGIGAINSWTQEDINGGLMFYVLNPSSNATADTFFFKLRDKGGNVLPNQPFHLTWCLISFTADRQEVNETDTLVIELQRRGHLQETVFVTITAVNGSARLGIDTHKWFNPQIQFNPGQSLKTWTLHIVNDNQYERTENFQLRLTDPVSTILEYPQVANFTITDPEDEPVVELMWRERRVSEDIGEIFVPVRRTQGDLRDELTVICGTLSGTATGTPPGKVLSGSDYFSRPFDHRSVIRFGPQEQDRLCKVTLIDDSLYEGEESFKVVLTDVLGGQIGALNETIILIEPDAEDEPQFSFERSEYVVDESEKQIEVGIRRSGTDLSKPSSVTIRSRMTNPKSAQAGLDYIAVNKILDFAPGVTLNTISIQILDDLGRPHLEGIEHFQIVLKSTIGGSLGSPDRALVYINDSVSDVPSMQFEDPEYFVNEEQGFAEAVIVRSGDISHDSSVRCYTRQSTARVTKDFRERMDTDGSLIHFKPGERQKSCRVYIVNDNIYEPDSEVFRLVLGNPWSLAAGLATVGRMNSTTIRINDDSDKPIIKFSRPRYFVNEPLLPGDVSKVIIPVRRLGDVSGVSKVLFHTKDGSAHSGKDYDPLAKELLFNPGMSTIHVEISILHDARREISEIFTVHLGQDRNGIAEVKRNARAQVVIEEKNRLADVVFPLRPLAVSLRDYDRASTADVHPVNGYPVICITACNPMHPQYTKLSQVCRDSRIDNKATRFRWKVAAPTEKYGVTHPLEDIRSTTFFAATNGITLDSIYFTAGSRVQCIARAFNSEGHPGKEMTSRPVIIDNRNGICMPRQNGSPGNQPYQASIRYQGPKSRDHPNTVKISVTIPHTDGLLPVVSTYQPSNFDYILTPSSLRVAQHQCSNLLDATEHLGGFTSNVTRHRNAVGDAEPNQHNVDLRSAPTLRFYRNLDIESCVWEITGYFGLSELVSKCGGQIRSDGQSISSTLSAITLDVWLYVSYVRYSPAVPGAWFHQDHQTVLPLTFVYNTGIMWGEGIVSPSTVDVKGSLYPSAMRVLDDGRLHVSFTTKAAFTGKFILQDTSPQGVLTSFVTSPDHPGLSLTLQLLGGDSTFNQPEQLWQFESNFAIEDYTGVYNISLIPCLTPVHQTYMTDGPCYPQAPVSFSLPVQFQQISDPVPVEYTLDTDFHLMRKKEQWMSEDPGKYTQNRVSSFAPGEKIYGRIDIKSVQRMGEHLQVSLEKVFICSGKDGYIPTFDPESEQYGCLSDSEKLQYHLKIIDRLAPFTVDKDLNGIPLSAKLAEEDAAIRLVKQPGADGFVIDTEPLFKSDPDRLWFLHVVYNLHSPNTQDGRIAPYHSLPVDNTAPHWLRRQRRSPKDELGLSGKGTNMIRIVLTEKHYEEEDMRAGVSEVSEDQKGERSSLIPILVGIAVLLCLTLILLIFIIRKKRKDSSPPPTPDSTMTVVSTGPRKVVVKIDTQGDFTEV
ncbi:extracellular matrix protein 3-like [Saccostrea cucullata]|uniref:extracellular matrix protein 3-like n=1 Tax=Saccostrea cuccullata TaxID=36930 RepID=UPI002ECFB560